MKYKNYYKILELKNDRVSDDEIKSAYRRLAKKYHPDINPGDVVASEKFKDVNEAYQILGNETSKKKYDRIHSFYRVKNSIDDTKEIPIRPIYVMTSGKGRILIGTYFEDTNKIEIKIYDINNFYNSKIRSLLDAECKLVNKPAKDASKKSSKNVVRTIFFFLAVIAGVCIGYLLTIL